MSFTLVTVLHDSATDLARLLASIARPPAARRAAHRGRHRVARRRRGDGAPPRAAVVVLDGNPGFGAANNAGSRAASHDVTVLLNPDCELLDDGLATWRAARRLDALHVPRLLDADGALQRSAHPLPGRPRALLRAVLPTRALPQPHRAPARGGSAGRSPRASRRRTGLLRRLGPVRPRRLPLLRGPRPLPARARARRADRPAPRGRGAPPGRTQRGRARSAARPSSCRRGAGARSSAPAGSAGAARSTTARRP